MAALIFFLGLCVAFSFSRIGFDTHHTGLMFRTALGVARGGVLFAEVFTQYGALTVWLQAVGILLFGPFVDSILLVTALFYAGAYCLFFLLARRFLPRPLSFVSALLAICLAPYFFWEFHPWSSVFSLFFSLLCTHALCICAEKCTPWPPFWAGLCALLAFWCRQPVGLVLLFAGVVLFCFFALTGGEWRTLWRFLLGALVGMLVFLVPIAATGALADFYRQSLRQMLTFAAERSGTGVLGAIGQVIFCLFGAPLDSGSALWYSYLWALLPLYTLALGAWCVWQLLRGRQRDAQLRIALALILVALASWHQYYPVFCQRHWYWGGVLCIPPTVLLVRLIAEHLCKTEHLRRALCALLLLGIFGTGIAYRVHAGTKKLLQTSDMIRYESDTMPYLQGLWLDPEVVRHFDTLCAELSLLRSLFPDKNVVNLTQNAFYDLLGEDFYHLYAPHVHSVYTERAAITADYIQTHRPIVIANHAPTGYVLYLAAVGDHADDHAAYHDLPANIYLPIEIYQALSEHLH